MHLLSCLLTSLAISTATSQAAIVPERQFRAAADNDDDYALLDANLDIMSAIAIAAAVATGGYLPPDNNFQDQELKIEQLPPIPTEPIPGDSPFALCELDTPHDILIHEINLVPNPPARGKNLTIKGSGRALKEVKSGAYVDIELRLGLIKLLTKRFDLCELIDQKHVDGLECPIGVGEHTMYKDIKLPIEIPPGSYNVVARAFNADGTLLSCLTGDLVFPFFWED